MEQHQGADGNDSQARRSRAIVVVGAGRSGTSALCRGLGALGVELGDRLKRAAPKNPKGFFEDVDLLDLNKRLHRIFDLEDTGTSLTLVGPQEWARRAAAVRALHDEAVATIRRRFGGSPLWGFKSGGLMRLLPFWEAVFRELDLEVSYVVAARNPLNVARSRARLNALRGRQEKSDLEWLVRVVPHFRSVAAHPFVVVDYDLLVSDPEAQLERIARSLALPMDDDVRAAIDAYRREFLRPRLRHHRLGIEELLRDSRINPLTRDAYRWLYRLACDEIPTAAPELWTDWRRIEESLELLAPALRHIDCLERSLERSVLRRLAYRMRSALPAFGGRSASFGGRTGGESAGN